MNSGAVLPFNRDKLTGFAAAALLHLVGIYGVWQIQFAAPRPEAPVVYVSLVNLTAPATAEPPRRTAPPVPESPRRQLPREAAPVTPQAAPLRQETAKTVQQIATPPRVNAVPSGMPSETTAAPTVIKGAAAQAQASPVPAARSASAPQPAPAAAQPVVRQDELALSCSDRPPPAYPKISSRLGEEGKTVLLVELDETGRVARASVKSSSGFPRLDEAALSAVKSWRCTPASRNGVALRSFALQPFNFTLKGR